MASTNWSIWKDYYFAPTGSYPNGEDYRIRLTGGEVIYSGRAYPRPGTDTISVRVNDICADYLTNVFPLDGADYTHVSFDIEYRYNNNWTLYDTVVFWRNWSYDTADPTTVNMDPIINGLHPSQYIPVPLVSGAWSIDVYYSDSTTATFSGSSLDGDCLLLPSAAIQAYGKTVEMVDNGYFEVPVLPVCGGFVLYYINAYGYWDSLVVQGRVIQSAGLTHYTLDKIYNNQSSMARGRENYLNELKPAYLLNIGPLTTAQSEKMHHLLGSPFVYLQDFSTGRIEPVVLTATTMERKDRHGAMHFYEVEASLAQERIRR